MGGDVVNKRKEKRAKTQKGGGGKIRGMDKGGGGGYNLIFIPLTFH
jgi:hypothetical protein